MPRVFYSGQWNPVQGGGAQLELGVQVILVAPLALPTAISAAANPAAKNSFTIHLLPS